MKHLAITHKRGDESYEYESRCMLGQLEARMRTTGQKFGSWSRQLADGTLIVVSILANGPAPIYRALVVPVEEAAAVVPYLLEIFLESGAYKVQVFDNVYSAQYIVGSEIVAQYAPQVDWDGSGSVTVNDIVCPLQTIPLPAQLSDWPPAPFIGSLDPRGYTISGSLRGTNQQAWQAISRVPASVFPGKLSLYVQSLYGSDRTDLTYYYPGGTGAWPFLLVDGFTLDFRSNANYILFTTSNYRYFLFSTGNSFNSAQINLTIRELVPHLDVGHENYNELLSIIEGLRETLTTKYPNDYDQPVATVPAQCSITEGVLLSLLKPSDTNYQAVAVAVPDDGGIIYGTPFEYGWDAKWGGQEASIVSITPDTLAFNTASRRLTLSLLGPVDVDGNPSFSGVLTSTGLQAIQILNEWMMWEPNGWDYSAFYVSVNFWMCGIKEPGTTVPDGDEFFDGFEFYGWYDDTDTWVPCTMAHIDLGDTSDPPVDYVNPRFCQYGINTQSSTSDQPTTHEIQRNITVGGHEVVTVQQPAQDLAITISEVAAGNTEADLARTGNAVMSGNRCYESPGDFFPEYNPFSTYCWDVDWGIYKWERERIASSSLTGRASAIVPFGTRKGLLYGRWHNTTSGNTYIDVQEPVYGFGQFPFELQEIKRKGDPCPPCCHEGLWSGANFNEKFANYSDGIWGADVVTTQTFVSTGYAVQWFAAHGSDVGISIYNEGTGGAGDPAPWEIISDNMALVGMNPPGEDNPNYSQEMSAFFEQQSICLGNRTLGVSANILRSSVFNSVAVHSNSSSMKDSLKQLETDNGYSSEDTGFTYFETFVGWA